MKKSLKLVSGVVAAAAFALVFSFNMSFDTDIAGNTTVDIDVLQTAQAEGETSGLPNGQIGCTIDNKAGIQCTNNNSGCPNTKKGCIPIN